MKFFRLSIIVSIVALVLSYAWAGIGGFFTCSLLILMEIGFSFDNAVVNASVLKHMNEKWQKRFLTWGILICVFGMYYLMPIAIVSIATGIGIIEVTQMALNDQESYTHHLESAHTAIAAFGGMFLLMVFLKFMFDQGKEVHWINVIETKLAKLGKLESIEIVLALSFLLILEQFLPPDMAMQEMSAGVFGVVLYVAVKAITSLFVGEEAGNMVTGMSGAMGFVYLNFLDASFSLDAVVGGFAISHDIVIIMLGLSAGAMFVRSITVYLVRKGTLDHYIFLEHGAHYGIGALAIIMLVSIVTPVSEVITGLIGITFILLALWSSVKHRNKELHV